MSGDPPGDAPGAGPNDAPSTGTAAAQAKPPAPWPTLVPMPPPPSSRRPPWLFACGGLVALVAVGVGAIVLAGRKTRLTDAELARRAFVIVDNAMAHAVDVTIGDESVNVPANEFRELRLPSGTYEAVARAGASVVDRAPLVLPDRGGYGPWRGVYNVAAQARYMRVRVTYTPGGRPPFPGIGNSAGDIVPFAVGQRVFELPDTPTLDAPIYERIFVERPDWTGSTLTFVCHVWPAGRSGCEHRAGNAPSD